MSVFSWYSGLPHQRNDRHDIIEILLNVALNKITLTPKNNIPKNDIIEWYSSVWCQREQMFKNSVQWKVERKVGFIVKCIQFVMLWCPMREILGYLVIENNVLKIGSKKFNKMVNKTNKNTKPLESLLYLKYSLYKTLTKIGRCFDSEIKSALF